MEIVGSANIHKIHIRSKDRIFSLRGVPGKAKAESEVLGAIGFCSAGHDEPGQDLGSEKGPDLQIRMGMGFARELRAD
jgi:hypothetical protein